MVKERPDKLPVAFFSELGVFVQPNFLDSRTCTQLRDELNNVSRTPSKVITAEGEAKVDPTHRPAKRSAVSEATIGWTEKSLGQVQPKLANFFDQPVHGFETPQFLVYQPGDFHLPHLDKNSSPQQPSYIKSRRFTVVIFLSSEGSTENEAFHGGGALTLYGLLDEPRGQKFGFPLAGEEGLLVAFPVSLIHEVTQVTHGKRYCIVSHAF